jgi:hypothetical protein
MPDGSDHGADGSDHVPEGSDHVPEGSAMAWRCPLRDDVPAGHAMTRAAAR